MPLHKAPSGLLHRSLVEIAEAAAEGNKIVVGQRLLSEEQHLMVEPCPVYDSKRVVVERAQVDALNLRSERGARGPYAQEMAALRRHICGRLYLVIHIPVISRADIAYSGAVDAFAGPTAHFTFSRRNLWKA